MLKKIFDNTNNITGRIASISINLVVIGISTVLLLGAVDTLRTRFKKSKKTEASCEQRDTEKIEKCFGDGVVFEDKKGAAKKNLKKKVYEPAGIDKPEDLPVPSTESQE